MRSDGRNDSEKKVDGKGEGEMEKKIRDRRGGGTSGDAFIKIMGKEEKKSREIFKVGRMEGEAEERRQGYGEWN